MAIKIIKIVNSYQLKEKKVDFPGEWLTFVNYELLLG